MEEFIFDDDAEDVGAEVEAHCPKCRADTTHVVVSKYEDEIRKVQCNSCSDVHAFRKPKGEDEEEATPAASKKKQKAKPTYDQVIAKWKKPPRTYAINEYFKELEVVQHPKFGLGVVTDNIGEDKIEVTFKEDKRVLIHNRKNLSLPFLRPLNPPAAKGQKPAAAAEKEKGKDKAGKGKAAATPEPVAAAPVAPAPVATAAKSATAKKAAAPAPANTKASAAARPAAKRPAEAKAPAKAAPKAAEKADKAEKPKAAPVKLGKAAAASSAKKKSAAGAAAKAKPAGRTAAHVAAKKPAKAKPVKKLSKKSR